VSIIYPSRVPSPHRKVPILSDNFETSSRE
jgi:hypothetical protein